jgi:hypothetical protein
MNTAVTVTDYLRLKNNSCNYSFNFYTNLIEFIMYSITVWLKHNGKETTRSHPMCRQIIE